MQVRSRLPRRRNVGLLLALTSALIMVVGGLFAPAAGAQDAPVAPAPAPAAGATSDAPLVTNGPDQLGARVSESDTATKRLNMAVVGLLGLAAVITVATVVFWKLSAPEPVERTAVSPAFRIEFIGDPEPTAPAWLSTSPSGSASTPAAATAAASPPTGAPDVTMEPVAPVAGAWASQGWGTES